MTKEFQKNTVAIILNELFNDSKKLNAQMQFDALIEKYAERIVKLFAIPNVSGSLPSQNDMEIEINEKANRITHEEHRFGFITGFEYCYEWITKTGIYSNESNT